VDRAGSTYGHTVWPVRSICGHPTVDFVLGEMK